jgi:hypothetical protein
MAHLQDLLGLSTEEAMNLSDKEVSYLTQKAQLEMYRGTLTSSDIRDALRTRMEPAVREVRAVRSAGGGGAGGVGAPNP